MICLQWRYVLLSFSSLLEITYIKSLHCFVFRRGGDDEISVMVMMMMMMMIIIIIIPTFVRNASVQDLQFVLSPVLLVSA
jgi:hypothetical protein